MLVQLESRTTGAPQDHLLSEKNEFPPVQRSVSAAAHRLASSDEAAPSVALSSFFSRVVPAAANDMTDSQKPNTASSLGRADRQRRQSIAMREFFSSGD
jgi:hypothetical protein